MEKILNIISTYGFSHGLIAALVLLIAWPLPSAAYVVAGLITAYAYWDRELTARSRDGTPKFKDWYLDSKMDAITPAVVVLIGFWVRFS